MTTIDELNHYRGRRVRLSLSGRVLVEGTLGEAESAVVAHTQWEGQAFREHEGWSITLDGKARSFPRSVDVEPLN